MPTKDGTLDRGGQRMVRDQCGWRCFPAKGKDYGKAGLMTSECILQLQS